MTEKDLGLLEIMREHCIRIGRTAERCGYEHDVFVNDNDYFDSVTLKIMQIGEYAKRLSDGFVAETGDRINWKAVKGMRDIVAHNYDSVDPDIIWDTATKNIPDLLDFLNDCLNNKS